MTLVTENPFTVERDFLTDLEALESLDLDEGLGAEIHKRIAPRSYRRMELLKKIKKTITPEQREKMKVQAGEKLYKHYEKVTGKKVGG